MHLDFTGKRALVTGGASGIGAATAALLRECGAEVLALDRETDVTNRAALEAAMTQAAPFHVVVANAGVAEQAELTATPEELWHSTVAINLTGAFHTVQIAARLMKQRGSGAIVLTASTNSFDGEPGLIAYNATKAGLLGILHTAANELGPHGIRVNAVCPGLIRTPLTRDAFDDPEVLKDYFQQIPLGRGGEAREVAAAIAFLASDLASYITGATLLIDGARWLPNSEHGTHKQPNFKPVVGGSSKLLATLRDVLRRSFLSTGLAFAVKLPHKIRVGMIGLEGHSGIVLDALNDLPDVELAAFYDPDSKRGTRLKAKRYSDYRELLEREKLDVVGVAGSNPERAPAILACAARKLHIAAEKPLALTRADLQRITTAVSSNGVRLTMFLPMRFYGSYSEMRRIVASGAIGEVAQVDAQKSYKLGARPEWMRQRDTYGGTIPYIGIHMVDLIRYTTGREITQAFSMQNRIGHPDLGDMENTTATLFRLDNGAVSALHMDYLRPESADGHGDDRLRIAGTNGVLEFQEHGGLKLTTDKQKEQLIAPLPADRSLFADFLEFVYNGKPAGLSLADIYRANEIVLAARESAERGVTIAVA